MTTKTCEPLILLWLTEITSIDEYEYWRRQRLLQICAAKALRVITADEAARQMAVLDDRRMHGQA